MKFEFEVMAPDAGRRLDRFVQASLGQVPAGLVQRLLRQKKVRVNDARESGSYRVRAGDRIVVHHAARAVRDPIAPAPARGFDGPIPALLHRDDDYLALGKPAGMACNDDGHDRANLPLWLRHEFASEIDRGTIRPEPCHRLDRGTTGIVLVSLHAAAHDRFRRALEADDVEKHYEVAVWAIVREPRRCERALARRPHAGRFEPRTVASEANGSRSARTDFSPIRGGEDCTLLAARIHTGRTHQVRAHCLAEGWPVVGDPRYGDRARRDQERGWGIDHPLLHARRLIWPGVLEIEADWPDAEAAALRTLGL